MKIQFRDFEFDHSACRLLRDGETLELRPKSALLIRYLLSRPGQIAGKAELIQAVWGHAYVEDQALFQLISELRHTLGDKSCIRTFPNRGYQWTWSVSEAPAKAARPQAAYRIGMAIAASIGLTVAVLLGWPSPQSQPTQGQASKVSAVSPAVDALAKAIEARGQGNLDTAIGLLETAIAEYPRFASAKLEMAETLSLQGASMRAQGYAYDALSDARLAEDRYMEVAAHLLLSRLRWQQGDLNGAIDFNSTAGEIARERSFMCAAELSNAMDRLLIQALTKPQGTALPPTLSQQSLMAGCNRSSSAAPLGWTAGADQLG